MKKKTKTTPVRSALRSDSSLQPLVEDGLVALDRKHRALFAERLRTDFADSLEIDENLKEGRNQENRWDYLVGHRNSDSLIAIEPHSAKTDEVSTIFRKKEAAQRQLRDHLREGVGIRKWLWVTEGKNHFANTEKIRRQLDAKGISFVGRMILQKDLD